MRKIIICSAALLVISCSSTYPDQDASGLYTANKATEMTNVAIGHIATPIHLQTPAVYYRKRVKALELVREEKWLQAKPFLEQLINEYRDDGDTWYLLGLTYFQTQQWKKAIGALERTLELGTILHGIPTGSPPSNDLMIKIAEAWSALGDEQAAIGWIGRALDARYDERPQLAGTHPFLGKNTHFADLEGSKAYQKVAGLYLNQNLSRDEAWRQDLRFLVNEVRRLHVNLYHATTPIDLQNRVDAIHKEIPSLTDREVVFEFMRLLSSIGNGHNFIIPAFGAKGAFRQLPLQFYWFSDGLYIVNASEEYQTWIGSQVVYFGATSAEDALDLTRSVNARDNEMQQLWLGPYYLSLPAVLEGLGIVTDGSRITLTVREQSGRVSNISPAPATFEFTGFPTLPPLANSEGPQYLARQSESYWAELLPEERTLFVQINAIQNIPSISLKDFSFKLREQMSKNGVDNLVLDLRHNSGGNGSLLPPLISTLVAFEVLKPKGKLFVLIGRNTFSAAHTLLVEIDRLTNAIIVGEPSGSRPNAMSESGWFQLPYSGITGIVSSQFHQTGAAEDHRIWIAPHVPVGLSSTEYFAGRDPAMEAVISITSTTQGK